MGLFGNLAGAAVFLAILGLPLEASGQSYSSPIDCDGCISWWYYVDHGETVDYTCGDSTYPGHRGTDYSLRGGNNAIENGNQIVAAASGVVTVASDGNFDRCTSCGGNGCGTNTPGGGYANYVVVDHGSHRSTYGHMRNGSVAVSEGDTVECGQVLGHIGSSGCSSGAHLHFQPRRAGAGYQEILDPYEGDCSPTLESLWVEQGSYRELPGDTCSEVPDECPDDTYETWTCSPEGDARRRCIDGIDSTEDCPFGCTVNQVGQDDECALPPDADGDGSRVDTDCNDDDASIHPAAIDSCGDGVDQDCSGADAICDPDVPGVGGAPAAGGSVGADPAGGASNSSGGALGVGGTLGSGGTIGAGGTLGSGGTVSSGGTLSSGGVVGSGGAPVAPPGAASEDPLVPSAESGEKEEPGCSCNAAPGKPGPNVPWGVMALGALVFAQRLRRRRAPGEPFSPFD